MGLTNENGQNETVLGRAFRDRPIKLIALSDRGAAVEVKAEGDQHSIGFRKEWVFRFDPQLFSKLSAAYSQGDSEALSDLWASAEPYRG
jgi:hypothetical protein